MKTKKLKKLAKLFHEEIRNYERAPKAISISEETCAGEWADYNPEVSEKFKKMILNLANYKNNIHINIDNNRVSISTSDITTIKNPKQSKSQLSLSSSKYSEEDYVEMSLMKDVGFSINYGYRLRSNYKDQNLFNEIQPILIQKLQEINSDNFNEIWTDLMRGSGILRDINLEEISNG
jgi:hypothetical protein